MITLETYHFTVGSSSGCDLRVKHSSVSRAHVKIYYSDDSVLLEDLNSEHGTFVLHNGEFKRIKSAKIKPDTIIKLGESSDGVKVKDYYEKFMAQKEIDKRDIAKRIKSEGLKRCFECGTVLSKKKIHCECCGAIFEESA